jgi:hypothetical protein
MAKKSKPSPAKTATESSPTIHEASRADSGSVRKGKVIGQTEAETRRKNGLDVVVCGPSLTENRNLAGQIEINAHGKAKRCPPQAGPRSLPHWQPDPRKPGDNGHTFYETKTAKHPEQIMRFFTPELYVRFNSSDDDEADNANIEWEKAIEQYERHLAKFRDRLPAHVRKLTELSLHDAEVLARGEKIQAGTQQMPLDSPAPFVFPMWTALAVVTVRNEETVRSLIYSLWDHIRTHEFKGKWPFSKEREHWLYDELDVVTSPQEPLFRGAFLHRVLLSTGTILEIPFTSVIIHEFALANVKEEVGR